MAKNQEIIKVFSTLAEDYSELISKREEANSLYFSESVPQPRLVKKSNYMDFYEPDCEKIVAGKYILDGKIVNDGIYADDALELTYQKNEDKIYIEKPEKKVYHFPELPKRDKLTKNPKMSLLSAILVVATLGVLLCIPGQQSSVGFMPLAGLFIILLIATIYVCCCTGGIFKVIINLIRLPASNKAYQSSMKKYKRDLKQYLINTETARIEYKNARQKYKQAVADAKQAQAEKNDELYEAIILDIKQYIDLCKKYFAKKKVVEEENDKQKNIIKIQYDAIVKKIQTYSDSIPSKYAKIPTFEDASTYSLGKTYRELKACINILESGRADTLKEAINCFVADEQAAERLNVLERQAMEQREQAEEQRRLLEEQAEEQRWQAQEQRRLLEAQAEEQREFNRKQAYEQRQRDEEQSRKADAQKELLERQTCAVSKCVTCERHGKVGCVYSSDGNGGCRHYIIR